MVVDEEGPRRSASARGGPTRRDPAIPRSSSEWRRRRVNDDRETIELELDSTGACGRERQGKARVPLSASLELF
uniref:Uncharacterized protein n=1 Tax=Oryza meridionalis TaxID=40149 RepID=A0A0E0ESX2_9ORYZ